MLIATRCSRPHGSKLSWKSLTADFSEFPIFPIVLPCFSWSNCSLEHEFSHSSGKVDIRQLRSGHNTRCAATQPFKATSRHRFSNRVSCRIILLNSMPPTPATSAWYDGYDCVSYCNIEIPMVCKYCQSPILGGLLDNNTAVAPRLSSMRSCFATWHRQRSLDP